MTPSYYLYLLTAQSLDLLGKGGYPSSTWEAGGDDGVTFPFLDPLAGYCIIIIIHALAGRFCRSV
jgi:hypothetical protein